MMFVWGLRDENLDNNVYDIDKQMGRCEITYVFTSNCLSWCINWFNYRSLVYTILQLTSRNISYGQVQVLWNLWMTETINNRYNDRNYTCPTLDRELLNVNAPDKNPKLCDISAPDNITDCDFITAFRKSLAPQHALRFHRQNWCKPWRRLY